MDSNEEADGQSEVVCEDIVLPANTGFATVTTLHWDEDTFAANGRELSLDASTARSAQASLPINVSCTWPSRNQQVVRASSDPTNSALDDDLERTRWVVRASSDPTNSALDDDLERTRWVLPPDKAPLFSSINQTRAWGEKDAKPHPAFAALKVLDIEGRRRGCGRDRACGRRSPRLS
eukprot:TRINITY_DN9142_c0_g2_i1.p2 TRINITY_DN9142_c0_g2~~TRINITY_DN9142_c0_g2_i1.p2  ORF type:complete len:178 (-),score=23.67 TRINITY_DN9142_c0_g2_i1:395-928(-)